MSGGGHLRIAILGDTYLPYLSGVTVATQTLAYGLAAAGHDVVLVVPGPPAGDGRHATSAAGHGRPLMLQLPSFQLPGPAPRGYRIPLPVPSRSLARAAAFTPDVVHAQSPFVSGVMARRLARRSGAPLVFTHHTRFADYGHYLGAIARPGRALLTAYLRAFWRGCAAIVAPGEDLASEIRGALAGRRRPLVRTIPTGVDVRAIGSLAPDDPRHRFGWPADAIVIAGLGRLAAEKSAGEVVEAFARVAASDDRVRLLFIGGGPLEDALRRRLVAHGLAGRAGITGTLQRSAALAALRACDLFVTASRTETQGLVVAEALAAGLPVVALDAPGVRDAVRDGEDGILAPADGVHHDRLAMALRQLTSDDELRARMARAALQGAARFDVSVQVAAVERLYRDLLVTR